MQAAHVSLRRWCLHWQPGALQMMLCHPNDRT